jgi:hypothetical protein
MKGTERLLETTTAGLEVNEDKNNVLFMAECYHWHARQNCNIKTAYTSSENVTTDSSLIMTVPLFIEHVICLMPFNDLKHT